MFQKLLVANRGEIACRVMRTAKRMGIATVAIYSEADAGALHVRMADEAVPVGPAPSAQSYLKIDKIVEAIKQTGADAVHPGYGFLSENAAFCRALDEIGVAFIGPGTRAIAAMGDKIESKRLAKEAGVSTIPGHMDIIADAEEAVAIARDIGFPVMIKASAGGGGKGMRVARSEAEARDGFRSAQSEAKSSFGDDRVFIEKFIEQPRHIEIQVLADSHGNAVYLGERECSIQRRHQKVIEEAPSPFIDPETRKAMGEQAVALAQAVDYVSAGTVEFVVDANRNFYFLEMNTRLQVEHPVTELVTGLDLVEQMIRVAAGEKLSFAQKDVRLDGWAMESRIYAEDPLRGFLPSIGRLTRYRPPEGENVRVDTGVYEGGEISMFYDPMIAKLITYGADRNTAIARMREALDAFYIRGVSHNIGFLASLLAKPRFVEGRLTTNFIAEEYPDGFSGVEFDEDGQTVLVVVGAVLHFAEEERATGISGRIDAGRYQPSKEWVVRVHEAEHPVTVAHGDTGWVVALTDREVAVEGRWRPGGGLFEGSVDGKEVHVQFDKLDEGYRLHYGGAAVEVIVRSPRAARFAARMPKKEPPDLSRFLMSPMPGMIVRVAVEEGGTVRTGDELVVVDAMKMENVLRAERDGTVAKIRVEAGASVAVDEIIMEFE